jgi:hypothetical protein
MPRSQQERRQERRLRLFVQVPEALRLPVLPQAPVRVRMLRQIPLRVPEAVRRQVLPQVRLRVRVPDRLRVLPRVPPQVPESLLLQGLARGPVQPLEQQLPQLERELQLAPTARRLRAFQPAWEHRPFSRLHRTQQA